MIRAKIMEVVDLVMVGEIERVIVVVIGEIERETEIAMGEVDMEEEDIIRAMMIMIIPNNQVLDLLMEEIEAVKEEDLTLEEEAEEVDSWVTETLIDPHTKTEKTEIDLHTKTEIVEIDPPTLPEEEVRTLIDPFHIIIIEGEEEEDLVIILKENQILEENISNKIEVLSSSNRLVLVFLRGKGKDKDFRMEDLIRRKGVVELTNMGKEDMEDLEIEGEDRVMKVNLAIRGNTLGKVIVRADLGLEIEIDIEKISFPPLLSNKMFNIEITN